MTRTLRLSEERFAFRDPFRIAGHLFTETTVLVAEISVGSYAGQGEAAGVYYLGDDIARMRSEAERVRADIEAGAGREQLQSLLPPGGARNALDCALWDFDAKLAGVPAWQMAGLDPPAPLKTTMTIGADEPMAMAQVATGRFQGWPMLKLKLTGEAELDALRVRAVRAVRPDAWIGVDANQGYTLAGLPALMEVLKANRVELLEQPLARGREADMAQVKRALPVAADESICSLAELDRAPGCFDLVNIKLDKCGGLTEGLAIARRCRELGIGVMVGNMMGSSLSAAPSLLLGQLCNIVDLDGPVFLAADRSPGVIYREGAVSGADLPWGTPVMDNVCSNGR
jgi:L-alanine-DL-glutamate epimerase-like enolase superfamily enzyme